MPGAASMKAPVLLLAAAVGAAPSEDRRLGFDFGTVTADSTNPSSLGGTGADPSLSSLMGGIGGMGKGGMMMPPGSGDMPMASPEQQQEANKNAGIFAQSAIMAFLNKQSLPPPEMQCIKDNSGLVGGNLGALAEQFGMILQKAFDVDIPLVPESTQTSHGGAGGSSNSIDMGSFGSRDEAGSVGSIADHILQKQSGMASGSPQSVPAPLASAPSPAKVQSDNTASMDLFYNSGRRMQASLPAMSMPDSSGGSGMFGSMGMPGMQDIPVAMEMGVSIKKVTDEMQQLVDTCMQPDAKLAFKQAASRMTSMKAITGHFLANGADVVNEMSDMVVAYDKKDPQRFGKDVGRAMRKVFLSNSTSGSLPEGLPNPAQLSNVSAGFLQGFFGPGTSLKVNLQKDPSHPLNIDMHNCVQRNTAYFQQIWGAVMYLFGQQEAGVGASTTASSTSDQSSRQVQFGTTLAFTMMELPQAMGKCGISDDQQSMIMDSVRSLGSGMDTKIGLPAAGTVHKKEIKEDFADTVGTFASHSSFDFGKKLGRLMQESAVKFYPQKYSVDASGILCKSWLPDVQQSPKLLSLVPAALAIAGAVIAVVRRRSSAGASGRGLAMEAEPVDELLAIEEALE